MGLKGGVRRGGGGKGGSGVELLGGADGIVHEEGDGHGADAAGVGGDFTGQRLDGGEVHVTDEAGAGRGGRIGDTVDAHIDDHGTGADHGWANEPGDPDGGDQDVGALAMGFEVGGAGMAEGDGGVGVTGFLE